MANMGSHKTNFHVKLILAILFLIFLIKLLLVHPTFSDENTYYAMGKSVSQGLVPYLDFNFAHPPLQLYILATLFNLFGTSLASAKLLPLISSSLVVVMMYIISKKLFGKNAAFYSSLLFIITPAFLAFSDQGYGIWESLLFLLISFYFSLKEKYLFSGFFFSIAFFTRYLSALFFPLLLLVLIFQKLKWKRFLVYSLLFVAIFFFSFYFIYGYNFIDQTILFQFFARTSMNILPKLPFQYLSFGVFSIFLAFISLFIGVYNKIKLVILFSSYALLIEILIFFGFNTIIYHYFLISLSFIFLALGKSFELAKDKFIQIGIIGIILISLYHNLPTIDYYQNPSYSQYIFSITDFVTTKTSQNDKIFGESSITSYIMFSKGVNISSNYLDSFLGYLVYKNESSVISNLQKAKTKVIIDMPSYYESNPAFNAYMTQYYIKEKSFDGIPPYMVYLRNDSSTS